VARRDPQIATMIFDDRSAHRSLLLLARLLLARRERDRDAARNTLSSLQAIQTLACGQPDLAGMRLE
jgi:hypothetical protein